MSYKHILAAVDLSSSSQDVIDRAIAMAKSDGSVLSLVFVEVDSMALSPKEELEFQAQLQALADKCDYPVKDCCVVIGDLHIKLSGLVKQMDIDLVVCGHHHKVLSRLFSHIPAVANAVESDLLVVYLDQ
ncbi:universal stress protein [Vibrio sp. ABG19]|uniref:universal stress protein n=1 Tax=Vibrio sp. ABG19 TaxID=2817385 RepID=UPI00249F76C6|nr:universal stress protein [Vibrio sp. ABG19]WGY44893.1 universal stress protein [Vibrio sp. ABG19]